MTIRRAVLTAIIATATVLAPTIPAAAQVAPPARTVVPMQAPGATWDKDELVLWSTAGAYAYRNVRPSGALSTTITAKAFPNSWDQLVPIDLDGDRQDELLRYSRSSGSYRYDDLSPSGGIASSIRSGSFATWDIIRAIDLDGDQRDEILFYNRTSGLYRLYDVSASGAHTAIRSGTWSRGLTEIIPIDLDGDQRDEIGFYSSSTLRYSYRNIGTTGSLGVTLSTGSYGRWTSITAVDIDGDKPDEILFYSYSSRRYAAYSIGSSGRTGSLLANGSVSGSYSRVAGLNLDSRAHPFVAQILALVNEERRSRGLTALTMNTQAGAEAQRWSQVQADGQRMYHRSDLFHGLPASATYVGENVAMGYRSAEAVMDGWMGSSGHRANILDARFRYLGVGVAADRDGTLYYTQIFFST